MSRKRPELIERSEERYRAAYEASGRSLPTEEQIVQRWHDCPEFYADIYRVVIGGEGLRSIAYERKSAKRLREEGLLPEQPPLPIPTELPPRSPPSPPTPSWLHLVPDEPEDEPLPSTVMGVWIPARPNPIVEIPDYPLPSEVMGVWIPAPP